MLKTQNIYLEDHVSRPPYMGLVSEIVTFFNTSLHVSSHVFPRQDGVQMMLRPRLLIYALETGLWTETGLQHCRLHFATTKHELLYRECIVEGSLFEGVTEKTKIASPTHGWLL